MAPTDPPTTITLRIKVAPGHIADYADEYTLGTNVPTSASIGQVRSRIQTIVPTGPSPERQRLLYGGRALVDNDQSLADALNTKRDPTQTEYVIHLLVKGDGASAASVPHRRGVNTPERSTTPSHPGGGTVQSQQPEQPHNPESASQTVHQPHQFPNHHHPALAGPQWRLPPQIVHQGPLAAQMPLGGFPFNLGGQVPGAGFGLPQMGVPTHGQPMVTPAHGHEDAGGQGTGLPAAQGERHNRDPTAAASDPQSAPDNPHNHLHNHHPGRPVSGQGVHLQGIGANGQRFTIHHQTVNLPTFGLPGPGHPFGFPIPGIGGPQAFNVPVPNLPARSGPSALDTNRQNIVDMMSDLDFLNQLENNTEEQRQHITRLRERLQRLSEYIDPFRLGPQPGGPQHGVRSNAPEAAQTPSATLSAQTQNLLHTLQTLPQNPTLGPLSARREQSSLTPHAPSSANPTCYLLSSPTGPRAILYSPQHGIYTGGNSTFPIPGAGLDRFPAPTPTSNPEQPAADGAAPPAPANPAEAAAAPQAQVPAAAPDPMGPLGPLLAHFWLLLRVLIFTYFLLGSNMGWRRPLILLAVIVGFWLLRAGLFGDGGVLRRWWDGIVQVPPAVVPLAPPAAAAEEEGEGDGRGRAAEDEAGEDAARQDRDGEGIEGADGNQLRRRRRQPQNDGGRMPTPEQVARRLLDQDAQVREAARRARAHWLRERVRPVERAAALFVASLWPGVGEAHVRAREREERRRAEEEVAARRRQGEEAAAAAAAEERARQESEDKHGGKKKVDADAGGEGSREGTTAAAEGSSEEKSPRVTTE